MADSQRKDTLITIAENTIAKQQEVIKARDQKIIKLEEGYVILEKKKDAECILVKSEAEVTENQLKKMTKSRNFWRFIGVALPSAIIGGLTYTVLK